MVAQCHYRRPRSLVGPADTAFQEHTMTMTETLNIEEQPKGRLRRTLGPERRLHPSFLDEGSRSTCGIPLDP